MTSTATDDGPEPTPPITCKNCGQPVESVRNPWSNEPDWIHSANARSARHWGCDGLVGMFAEVNMEVFEVVGDDGFWIHMTDRASAEAFAAKHGGEVTKG